MEKYEFILGESGFNLFPKMSLAMNFSTSLIYKFFYFEIRYIHQFLPIGEAGNLYPLDHRFHSIHFIIGVTI